MCGLAGLEAPAIELLLDIVEIQTYHPHEVLAPKHATDEAFFIIVSVGSKESDAPTGEQATADTAHQQCINYTLNFDSISLYPHFSTHLYHS